MNYAVIMAGGSGQRLWPLSRRNKPKQIINLFREKSLLENCLERIRPIFDPAHILVVTNAQYAEQVHKHLPELPQENILGEPAGRDTANAIGLAAMILRERNHDATMAVFSADQIIEPVGPLHEAIRRALAFIEKHSEALFTFGIKPSFAHTGFGYLKKSEEQAAPGIHAVEAFKEKPNKSTASKYVRSGQYCWNSGMFIWRVATITRLLEEYLPHNADRLARIGAAWTTPQKQEVLTKEFPELERISIDYGVMEKARDVYMCELDCHWMDVGSYQALADTIGKIDDDDNVATGKTLAQWLDSSNNIVISESPDHLIAAIGIEDLVVVHTQDATLICRREEADRIKELLAKIEASGLEKYL